MYKEMFRGVDISFTVFVFFFNPEVMNVPF